MTLLKALNCLHFHTVSSVQLKTFSILWQVTPCRLVEIYLLRGRTCCLRHQGVDYLSPTHPTPRFYTEEGGSMFVCNFHNLLPDYTV